MIQIEAETLQQLLTVQRQLTGPCAGLRIQLSGDSRQGGQVSLEWSREQRTEDYAVACRHCTLALFTECDAAGGRTGRTTGNMG
jgi:hypothetical protein